MKARRTLAGITWNHTRVYPPLVATARRFTDTTLTSSSLGRRALHRSFADVPILRLVNRRESFVGD